MAAIRAWCGEKMRIEANDVATISLLGGAPFVSGPLINTFNEATIDFLVARGATRIGLPVELSAAAIATLARHNPVETEALVFGRQGLSLSMRCYHARAYGLHKDSCQFVCELDPDGLAADQLDGKPLLVVNGTQTLSHGYAAAFADLAPLQAAGVTHFRLSPQTTDMVKVASLFRAALDGEIAPAEAEAELAALIAPTPLIDGYMRGKAGMSFSGAARRIAPRSLPIERRREARPHARRRSDHRPVRRRDARRRGESFELGDRRRRQLPPPRRRQHADDVVRAGDAGAGIGAEIDDRPLRAALADHRLARLGVKPFAQALIAVEGVHVGQRRLPQHAMDLAARIARRRQPAFAHDRQAVARQPRRPQRFGVRAAHRHAGDVHVRAVGEIERHDETPTRAR